MPRHQQEIFAKEALRLPAGWNSSILWPVNQQYIPYGRRKKCSFCFRPRWMEKWDLQLLIVTAALSPFLVPGNILQINRPFPSCPKPLFQSEAKCQANDMKMIFLFSCKYHHHHLLLILVDVASSTAQRKRLLSSAQRRISVIDLSKVSHMSLSHCLLGLPLSCKYN